MMIVERWVDACSGVDVDASPLIRKEMKDFLGKMASLGVEYRAWSHRVRDKLKLEVSQRLSSRPDHHHHHHHHLRICVAPILKRGIGYK